MSLGISAVFQMGAPGKVRQAVIARVAVEMARNISGAKEGETHPPALLITDNAILRYAAKSGYLAGIVGPSHSAVHLSRGRPTDVDLWNTYVRALRRARRIFQLLMRPCCICVGGAKITKIYEDK